MLWKALRTLYWGRGKQRMSTISDEPDGWHSWDPHPWQHPWLSQKNLEQAKAFSQAFLEKERQHANDANFESLRFAFVGNLANSLYLRVLPLRKGGVHASIFMHPQDSYCMSDPSWEHFDGSIEGDVISVEKLQEAGIRLPTVDNSFRLPERHIDTVKMMEAPPSFIKKRDIITFSSYLSHMDTLEALQDYDAVWGAQALYLPYLSGRPYVASQTGGDIWFEASRGDFLGQAQRTGFREARAILVSNPWTYAHARRLGFNNLVYLPLILDEEIYCPGVPTERDEWIKRTGGDFFVLMTSRVDQKNKGSISAIEGFRTFANLHPGARLVLTSWGVDRLKSEKEIERQGLADRVLWLPLAGKARVRRFLRSADCILDQFILGYFGAAGLEAMACGLPVIGRTEVNQYKALCETGAPPILNAKTPEQITRNLMRLAGNEEYRKKTACEHRSWFLKNHGSARWLPDYKAVLTATALRAGANFTHSPVAAPLSEEEMIYHSDGLKVAPPFPNYGW